MRHPLHVALPVPAAVPAPAPAPATTTAARHRKPRRPSPVRTALAALALVPPAGRLAAGLGAASVLAATALTAVVEPAAPVAPDRVPARQGSTFAQLSGH
ncbi:MULTISPECIES: hypothetical protein [unclassified Streptomyces]|uniref:hypothetical protein n=1 Tax=unclassified Streptomyces TaxID=2593676 RepID=UPI0004C5AC44|nr:MULTISPECIES: hypothetical protein [unclassified Streptomyces]